MLCCLFLSHTWNSWTEKGKMGGRRCIGPYTGQRGECTRSNQSCLGDGQCCAPKKGCSQKANALQHFQNTLFFPQISLSQLKCTYLPSEKQKKYFEKSPWFTSALSRITRALKKKKKQPQQKIWKQSNSQLGFGPQVKICERRPKIF